MKGGLIQPKNLHSMMRFPFSYLPVGRPVPLKHPVQVGRPVPVEFSEIKTLKLSVSYFQQYVMYVLFAVVYTSADPGGH